jgi:hypothetical protein
MWDSRMIILFPDGWTALRAGYYLWEHFVLMISGFINHESRRIYSIRYSRMHFVERIHFAWRTKQHFWMLSLDSVGSRRLQCCDRIGLAPRVSLADLCEGDTFLSITEEGDITHGSSGLSVQWSKINRWECWLPSHRCTRRWMERGNGDVFKRTAHREMRDV